MAVIAMVTLLSLRSVAQVMSAMQGSVPEMLTLEQAVVRAASNESAFAAAAAAERKAWELERKIARSALLPTVEA